MQERREGEERGSGVNFNVGGLRTGDDDDIDGDGSGGGRQRGDGAPHVHWIKHAFLDESPVGVEDSRCSLALDLRHAELQIGFRAA